MSSKNIRVANVYVHDKFAATFTQEDNHYTLKYDPDYVGPPISLTLPVTNVSYTFDTFPAFFDGVLPEGPQLEALLKLAKLDRHDYFGQLLTVGRDLVGAVTVLEGSTHE
jgi:serine/threonine-protein kinase HipA